MADTGVAPGAGPAPQPNAGAPGFDNAQNGHGNQPHMPPPPLHIPQNTNPIPTAVTSPLSGDKSGILSPSSGGSFMRRAAPEPNKRALYVGGLDPRVTEEVLRQIFETTGHVQNVKIIPDKNVGAHCSAEQLEIIMGMCTYSSVPRLRASIMGLSNTMTPARPSEPCRH